MKTPEEQRRLLEAFRAGLEPTSAQLDAVWSDVSDPDARRRVGVDRFEEAQRAPTPYLGIATALVAVAAAVAVWWVGLTSSPSRLTPSESVSEAPYQDGSTTPEHRVSPRVPSQGESSPVVMPPTPPLPEPPVEAPHPAAPRAKSPPKHEEPQAPTSPTDSLAEEAELLRQAERRLRGGDPNGALEVLDTCGRMYPGGELVVERKALRVIALCRSGNAAQGRGEAAVVRIDAASRPYRERIRRACEIE